MIPMTATAMPLFLLLSMYDTDTVGEAIKLSLAPIFLIGALGHYRTVLVIVKTTYSMGWNDSEVTLMGLGSLISNGND